MYKSNAAAKEHNIHFAIENQWNTDIESLHSEEKRQLCIKVMETSKIIQMDIKGLIAFYEDRIKYHRIFRVNVRKDFVQLQHRLLKKKALV